MEWNSYYNNERYDEESRMIKSSIISRNLESLKELIGKDPDHFQGRHSVTALDTAVRCRDPRMVILLLDHIPNLSQLHLVHLFRVMYAEQMHETAQLLINAGVDINSRGTFGPTILHYAARYGCRRSVKLLLEKGARVNVQNDRGVGVIHEAATSGDFEVISLLLRHGAEPTLVDHLERNALHYLSYNAQVENQAAAELLLANGLEVDVRDRSRHTPLHLALVTKKELLARYLIERGADVNAITAHGDSALMFAVEYGSPWITELLLSKGADVNAEREDRLNALHMACKEQSSEKLLFLLKAGAVIFQNSPYALSFFHVFSIHQEEPRFLIRQLVKFNLSKVYVCDDDLKKIEADPELRPFYKDCWSEIEKMKEVRLYRRFTIYHLFTAPRKVVAEAARDVNFVERLDSVDLNEEFPIWAEELRERYLQGRNMKHLWDMKERELAKIFGLYLPESAIETIAFYMCMD